MHVMFTLMALRTTNLKSPTTRGPRQPGVEVRIPGGDTPDGKSGTSGSLGKTTTGAKAWRSRGGNAMPGGWQPQKLGHDLTGPPRTSEVPRGPSEKMVVPSFSGAVESGSEDIGASARSYMRQIAAWRRMTRIEPSRQALTLYQHLSGKAWIDAERLDVDKLAGDDGMEYFLGWVTDRYLDVQVTQVGRSLGLSFEDSRGPEAVPGPKVFYPKKISIEAYNLLTSDKVSFFDPSGWSTSNVEQKSALLHVLGALEANPHSRCCGSEELLSVEPPSPPVLLARPLMASRSPLLTAPTVTKQKGLWDLRRDELLMEAEARGLTIHEKWTVPEIRSIIQEDMKRGTPATEIVTGETVPLTKMTIKELENALEASGIAIPEKANKGMLMRMLRDQGGRGPQTVLAFGRFKGRMYQETPISYRRWAVQEVSENDGAQEDLKMFAAWASRALEITDGYASSSVPPPYVDSEHSARIPYNPESFGGSSWDVVPTRSTTTTRTSTRPKARPTRTENEVIEQRIQAQRRQAPPSSLGSHMDQEIDPQVMDEIQYLQARLAVLRDRHGMMIFLAPSTLPSPTLAFSMKLGGTSPQSQPTVLMPTEFGAKAILAGLSETNADLIRFLKFEHLICFVKEILPEDLLYYLNLFNHEIILKPFLALRVLVTRTPVEPIAILADFLVIPCLRHYPYQVIQFPVTRTPMEPVAILADFLVIPCLRHYLYQVFQFPVTRTPVEPVAILADFLVICLVSLNRRGHL
ncbi:unnamed protein product [Symbiodinium sp. CCMP2592]|nr:unnamed protein product [Symbiodinium sp. CCMP2592]